MDVYTLCIVTDRPVKFLSLRSWLTGRNNIGAAVISGMEFQLRMDRNNSYSIALLVFFPGYLMSCFSS